MVAKRALTHLLALGGMAACLAACGQAGAGNPGAAQHTRSIPNESASPLVAGVDPLTGLEQRPLRPPSPSADGTCVASGAVHVNGMAPNYGAGVGPVYLSGQLAWYSAAQVAVLTVDSQYSGPLLVRPFQLGADGKSTVDLTDIEIAQGTIDKERFHGVALVPAVHTPASGLYFPPTAPSSLWRGWLGSLSISAAGCFGLQVDGDVFTEYIVFLVNPGNPPPG